jgi:hypothetical protein
VEVDLIGRLEFGGIDTVDRGGQRAQLSHPSCAGSRPRVREPRVEAVVALKCRGGGVVSQVGLDGGGGHRRKGLDCHEGDRTEGTSSRHGAS